MSFKKWFFQTLRDIIVIVAIFESAAIILHLIFY